MNEQRGICTNYGHCIEADKSTPMLISKGAAFVCTQCGKDLIKAPAPDTGRSASRLRTIHMAGIAACVLAVFVSLGWYLLPGSATAARSTSSATPKSDKMLRFAGSNTIGSELLPALAEAYLKQQGVTEVKRVKGTVPEEMALVDANNPKPSTTIEIASHGSGTAFTSLAERKADVGMASRKIKTSEVSKLALLGDLSAPTREHVLALDGIAVIVNRHNPVSALSKEQIAAIFSGVITNWGELKRTPGPINLYTRDEKSGTYDTFKSIVLENLKLSQDARRFEDSVMLSENVANDPNGIGFVGLPFVKNAKALAVSDGTSTSLLATRLTVATEDYPLARRLFLYTPDNADNPHVRKFTEFVLSKAGQDIVKQYGFVELNVQTSAPVKLHGAPPEYAKLVTNAERLSLNFRFLPGSHRLDNKAVRDLDRVIEFVEQAKAADKAIMLFGFSDATGDDTINLKLSKDRAKAIADELTKRGVKLAHVEGYGASLPVASNDSREGRDKNRRVEVWIRK